LCFFFNKIREEGRTVSAWKCGGIGGVGVGGTMYTHVSKCKNDKIKGENFTSNTLFSMAYGSEK
jgi:hypothetical protein